MSERHRKLAKEDLRAFDAQSTDLVLEMVDSGWRGKISTKGHALLYAPDGFTSMSVARDSSRARSGKNARAEFERWRKLQMAPESAEFLEGLGLHVCGICKESFKTSRGLGTHARTHLPAMECPQCGKEVRYLTSHLQREHSVGGSTDPVECLLGVLTEIESLRAENTQLRADLAKAQARITRKIR